MSEEEFLKAQRSQLVEMIKELEKMTSEQRTTWMHEWLELLAGENAVVKKIGQDIIWVLKTYLEECTAR